MESEQKKTPPNEKTIARYSETLRQNLGVVEKRIVQASQAQHHKLSVPRLLAVSKTHPPEAIVAACGLGICEFGENYAQELKNKKEFLQEYFPDLLKNLKFVFLGRIQSNKIPLMIQYADEIQSVGSLEHALSISKQLQKFRPGQVYPIWLLVNAGQETTKTGFTLEEIPLATQELTQRCPNLDIQGLMAIPPPLETLLEQSPSQSPGAAPPLYWKLRELSRHLPLSAGRGGLLSLGMSEDLEAALVVGTDCIRLGTALFGPRLPKDFEK